MFLFYKQASNKNLSTQRPIISMDFQSLKMNLEIFFEYIVTFVYHLAHIKFLVCTMIRVSQSYNQFMGMTVIHQWDQIW